MSPAPPLAGAGAPRRVTGVLAVDEPGVDLYDTEYLRARQVLRQLRQHTGTHRDRGSFEREVRERFAEIGLVARVMWYQGVADGQDMLFPDITIVGRVEPELEFDHDRMAHEVRANVLGLPRQPDAPVAPVAVPRELDLR